MRRWCCPDLQQDLLLESTTSQIMKSKVLHKAHQTCGIEQIFFSFLIKMLQLAFLSHPRWKARLAVMVSHSRLALLNSPLVFWNQVE